MIVLSRYTPDIDTERYESCHVMILFRVEKACCGLTIKHHPFMELSHWTVPM